MTHFAPRLHLLKSLGVAGKVGSLEVGKDATLFVSKGNALTGRTNSLDFVCTGTQCVAVKKQTKLAKKYRIIGAEQK